ncbi:hypothetical protein N9I17_00735 [Amylibacter sp.]|nr:hypothetical protein [Amylibacter sp.]
MSNGFRKILDKFDDAEIVSFCWKGLSKIDGALIGCSDLDLFVDFKKIDLAKEILNDHNWFCLKPAVSYEFIEHYFFWDGHKFLHLHIYWKLRTGLSSVKNSIISFDFDYNTMVFRDCMGIRVPDTPLCKALNMTRKDLKKKNLFSKYLFGKTPKYKKEDHFLKDFFPHWDDAIPTMVNVYDISTYWILNLVKNYMRRLLAKALRRKRSLPSGTIVSFIGTDGSGKSTLSKSVLNRFDKILTVKHLSFGLPKFSLLTSPIYLIRSSLMYSRSLLKGFFRSPAGQSVASHKKEGVAETSFIFAVYFVALAIERYAVMSKAQRFADLSFLVLLDRCPSMSPFSFDCPKIHTRSSQTLVFFLMQLERRLYRSMTKPNLVLKLEVNLETALQRNSSRSKIGKETDNEIIERLELFKKFVPAVDTVEVLNANIPFDEVLDIATNKIIERLARCK